MSAPSRRRNPTITRGKKSDRRKKKLDNRKQKTQKPDDGFGLIHEMANEKRKLILRGDSSSQDHGILSEPPPIFFEKTEIIRSKQRDSSGTAILLQESRYERGVPTNHVKQERILVLKGQKSRTFHGLKKQFNQHKAKVKQEARKTDLEVIEKARLRESQNREMAAKEAERKRVEMETERSQTLAEEQKKIESERLAKLELEKLQETSRQMAIQEKKLKSEQEQEFLRNLEREDSREKAIQQKKGDPEKVDVTMLGGNHDRLESDSSSKSETHQTLGTEILQTTHETENRFETPNESKVLKEEQVVITPSKEAKTTLKETTSPQRKKNRWIKIWKKIRDLFPSRFSSKKRLHNEATKLVDVLEIQTEDTQKETSEMDLEKDHVQDRDEKTELHNPLIANKIDSDLMAQENDEPVEEVEIQEPEAESMEEVEATVPEVDELVEEIEIQNPEGESTEEVEATVPEIDEPVEDVEIQEPEAESMEEVEATVPDVDELVEEIEIQNPEAESMEEVEATAPEVDELVEEIEIENPEAESTEKVEATVPEIDEPVEDVEIQEPEAESMEEVEASVPEPSESVAESDASETIEHADPSDEFEVKGDSINEEALPEIKSGEVMLADMRLSLQKEPEPSNYVKDSLMKCHGLSEKNVKRLIEYVASPFSICKTMEDNDFDSFIDSLNTQEVSGGQDVWTKIIEIVGHNSISEKQQVEIYDLFMGEQTKTARRVKMVAILYHFLPARFEHWWEGKMILSPVSKKYSKDYDYFKEVDCSPESIEDARMFLCAYALEKPKAVANEFTYSKHLAGEAHESNTEKWLKRGGQKIDYITQTQIPEFAGKKYGNKHVSRTVTPDILLKNPIQLTNDGQHIHWIDAKNHFIDPALSPENLIDDFCGQLEKYVRRYGPGLIVWGKSFSEEWNEATEGVVQHIKI